MRQTTVLHCTRCGHATSENDLDVRFKQGDIIACSGCLPVVIIIPTEAEIKMPMRDPMRGNRLDAEIERKSLQDIFFVSLIDFEKSTLERLGCQRNSENKRKIFRAFMKATKTLIHAIVAGEMKSRYNNDC